MAFADLLAELKGLEDSDMEPLKALAVKYPDLDKQLVSVKDLRKAETARDRIELKLAEVKEEIDGWNKWRDNNWDQEKEMTLGERQALEAKATLEAQLATLNGGGKPQGDGKLEPQDFAQLTQQLAEAGYVKKTDIAGIEKLPEVQTKLGNHDQVLAGFEHLYRKTAHLPQVYREEIGQKLGKHFDMGAFIDYVGADGERAKDLNKAFTDFVAADKSALDLKTQTEALVADRAKLDADRAALEVQRTSGPNPTDESGSGPAVGFFQRRVQHPGEKSGSATEGLKLGSGATAAIAAELYRKGELVPKES